MKRTERDIRGALWLTVTSIVYDEVIEPTDYHKEVDQVLLEYGLEPINDLIEKIMNLPYMYVEGILVEGTLYQKLATVINVDRCGGTYEFFDRMIKEEGFINEQ